jgi:succinate dehydrogenase flavin-adding protein (antitoxin of CptAB toxin-antitoxin module)
VQADGWQECILKVLFQKRRGMRELVSSRMCFASERVDALEVEIAALDESGERGIDE